MAPKWIADITKWIVDINNWNVDISNSFVDIIKSEYTLKRLAILPLLCAEAFSAKGAWSKQRGPLYNLLISGQEYQYLTPIVYLSISVTNGNW